MEKSHFESEAFGLNFYRADETFLLLNKEHQLKIISENSIDIIKLSIDANNQEIVVKINETFDNVCFFNTIINYHIDTTKVENFPTYYDCEILEASLNDIELLKQLITDIFKESTFGYFSISILKNKISAALELEAMINFITDMLGKPNKGIQLLHDKKDDKIIGFTTYSIAQNIAYCAYAGILENYRNNNYYEELINKMMQYNFKNNYTAIAFGVRANNIFLINKYNRIGSKVLKINYVFLALISKKK